MNSLLFSEDLGLVSTDKELEKLQQQFPKYDPAYVCQAAGVPRKRDKEWLEKLWLQYKPYADKNFLVDFKKRFTQRAWELYLGVTFLNRGFSLSRHNSGPDFDLRDKNTNQRLAWVEAIAVQKGIGNDRVPDVLYGSVVSVPEDEMLLRLSGALKEKFEKYRGWLDKKTVKDNEPYIIAIDRSDLQHVDASAPLILKTLFGIGDLTITFEVGDYGHKPKGSFWSELTKLDKRSGKPVPMKFFLDPDHTGVSAVIYSRDNILNCPRVPEEMGENFLIAYNPQAKNPLPVHFFPFGIEFQMKGNSVTQIREQKRYKDPDIFGLEK